MNTIDIGNFIRDKRKELGLTQTDLAEKLNISFQAVSKWETGTSLPDTTVLLDLAEILNVSVDKLLHGGKSRGIHIGSIVEGFNYLKDMRNCFGPHSTFYKGAVQGINQAMNINIETALQDSYHTEVMITEVILQYMMEGYTVDLIEVEEYIQSEKMIQIIQNYKEKYN